MYRSVQCNAHRPGTAANNRRTVKLAAAKADVLKLNEANDPAVVDGLRALGSGWSHYIPPGAGNQNTISWRHGVVTVLDKGWATIYKNKAGVADGPDRVLVWALIEDNATKQKTLEVVTHFIHQAFTSHPERLEAWRTCLAMSSKTVLDLLGRFPGVPVVISGDFNAPGAIDFHLEGERELKSPGTFGAGNRRRYDRYFTVGNIAATGLKVFDVDSDHLAVTVNIGTGAVIPPAPVPPKEDDQMARISLGKDSSGRPLVVDSRTLTKLQAAEARLSFKFTIVQGSYRAGDGATSSAGTHDGGGVIDLRSWNILPSIGAARAVRVLRECGLIAWYRTEAQGFDPHIHAIDYGNPALSPSAARQVTAWEAGRNGLASNGPDDGPRVPIPKDPPTTEDDDMALSDELALWYPGDSDGKDKMRAGQQLGQARGYAQEAYNRTVRLEAAVAALAKALGPTVEAAVQGALADAVVNVDVNVTQGDK